MTLKNPFGIYFFRILLIALLSASLFNLKINYAFFGFVSILFTILFLFSGYPILTLCGHEIEIKFQRLFPILTKYETISLHEIKSIEFYERKITFFIILLNLIERVPKTTKRREQIIIHLINGENHIIPKINSKNKFKKAFEEIDKTIIKNKCLSYKGKSYSKI